MKQVTDVESSEFMVCLRATGPKPIQDGRALRFDIQLIDNTGAPVGGWKGWRIARGRLIPPSVSSGKGNYLVGWLAPEWESGFYEGMRKKWCSDFPNVEWGPQAGTAPTF